MNYGFTLANIDIASFALLVLEKECFFASCGIMNDICPFCKKEITAKSESCPHCGSLLADAEFKAAKGIEPGTMLSGRYRIVREVGKGGMGTVYMAEETVLETGRHVAIKLLPPQLTMDPAILARFQEEIKTAARLDHPFIVPIYFVGEHNGQYFFVMKYLEGGTISQWIKKKGPMSEQDTRRILAKVTDALYYAHKHGVIHRDIKAGNIMLSPEANPTLMDFGVARTNESSELTMDGQIVGTAEYMAPEQWYGEVDPRSDLYAMGIVAYYMLTGHLPFRSRNTFELMKMHQEQTPAPVRAIRPEISSEMDAIITWCLMKERESRVPDAATLTRAFTGEISPPQELIMDQGDPASSDRTTGFHGEATSTFTPAASWRENKIVGLLENAEKSYKKGDLTRAIKIITKAEKLDPQSKTVQHRKKKYTNLKSSIAKIKVRAERGIRGGFIRQAIADYEKVLQVYDIPEIKQLLAKAQSHLAMVERKFAEAVKLQKKGELKLAFRALEEVTALDAENEEALLRKQELRNSLQKTAARKREKTQMNLRWLRTAFIMLVVATALVGLVYMSPTLIRKSADYTYKNGMYGTPAVFNTYTLYKLLDIIEPEGAPERQKIVAKMIEEKIEEGLKASQEDRLRAAVKSYSNARQMMVDGSELAEELDEVIDMLETRIKVQ